MIDPNMHSQFREEYYQGMANASKFAPPSAKPNTPQSLEISSELQYSNGPSHSEYRFVVSRHKDGAALAQVEHLQSVGIDAVFRSGHAYVKDAETCILARVELGLR